MTELEKLTALPPGVLHASRVNTGVLDQEVGWVVGWGADYANRACSLPLHSGKSPEFTGNCTRARGHRGPHVYSGISWAGWLPNTTEAPLTQVKQLEES